MAAHAQAASCRQFRQQYITRLDSVIQTGYQRPNAPALFAAIYRNVADQIITKTEQGVMHDTVFVLRIETAFAASFLQAIQKDSFIQAWQPALNSNNCTRQNPMPGLLMAINAHVNNDLLPAMNTVMQQGYSTNATQHDYGIIFKILNEENKAIGKRYQQHVTHTPFLKPVALWLGRQFALYQLKQYRKKVFRRLQQIEREPAEAATIVALQQQKAAGINQRLLHPKGLLKMGLRLLRNGYQLDYDILLSQVLHTTH